MNPVERPFTLMRRSLEYLTRREGPNVLGLLGGLPKEQVRTDGGSKDSDHGRQIVLVPMQRGNDKAFCGLRPRHLHHEHASHIGKQKQCQPFQNRYITGVVQENLKCHADGREQQNIENLRTAKYQSRGVGHRAEVRSDIDGISNQQHCDDCCKQPRRTVLPQVACDTASSSAPHAGAHDLNRRHQRISEEHGPSQRVPELRAGLRVRRDPAGVVVRSTRDQAGTQDPEQPRLGRFDDGALAIEITRLFDFEGHVGVLV